MVFRGEWKVVLYTNLLSLQMCKTALTIIVGKATLSCCERKTSHDANSRLGGIKNKESLLAKTYSILRTPESKVQVCWGRVLWVRCL